MDDFDYWRLCDHFTIAQAALLITGGDANDAEYVEMWEPCNQPRGYIAMREALAQAIIHGTLKSRFVPRSDSYNIADNQPENIHDMNFCYPDIYKTTIAYDDIRGYLKQRGLTNGFFALARNISTSTATVEQPNFPPKLLAAIAAFNAVYNDPALQKGKSAKQALEDWLTKNAKKFQLLKKDGTPNKEGIEQICKVANWKPEGGATPTPSGTYTQNAKSVAELDDIDF